MHLITFSTLMVYTTDYVDKLIFVKLVEYAPNLHETRT
jgi:hypothetical protein